MNSKVRVAIEDVLKLDEKCREINDLDFDSIIWTKNGEEIEIDRTCFHNWFLSGLSNMTFILSGAYKKPQYRIYHFE